MFVCLFVFSSSRLLVIKLFDDVMLHFFFQLVDAVRRDLVWNNRLEKFAWRVDLKTKTRKSNEEINEPCAMVELNLAHGAQVAQSSSSSSSSSRVNNNTFLFGVSFRSHCVFIK